MKLNIYIGPYIEADVEALEIIYQHTGLVDEGRGECRHTDGDKKVYAVPYDGVPGIDRQMDFSNYELTSVVPISHEQVQDEQLRFRQCCGPVIRSLNDADINYVVRWGIVPDLY